MKMFGCQCKNEIQTVLKISLSFYFYKKSLSYVLLFLTEEIMKQETALKLLKAGENVF
jgi:hypothetical protein